MEHSTQRPQLNLHVFGSSGSGKNTFKKLWNDNSYSHPISEIADVRILIQQCGSDVESWQLPTIETDDMISHTFLVIYQSDNQDSQQYAQRCLLELTSCYSGHSPQMFVLENHFDLSYIPQHSEPSHLPLSLSGDVQEDTALLACKFWPVQFENGLDQRIIEHILVAPIMDLLDEDMKLQLIVKACTHGQLTVLQLLAGRVAESSPVGWIMCVMASLHRQPSSETAVTSDLLLVAEYLYNLDPTLFLSTVVRMTKTYPRVALELINKFRPQGQSPDHFVKIGLALFAIPVSWIQNGKLTHINLSNNLLLELPQEIFRIATLKGLNVAHNCLGSIPDILKWNCPYLRELNLSYNRLLDTQFCILNRPRSRTDPGISEAGAPRRADQQARYDEAKRLYHLTGYNLYPCVHSLNWVYLSGNSSLTQIPEWVCVLPHLTLLELKDLPKLTSLTPYLAHCRNLCILKIDVHQLVSPPAREIAECGTRGIMAYLRCQLRGSSPYRHLKLVLVGANGTGKTTLFSQIARLKSHPLTVPSSSVSRAFMELATLEYRGSHKVGTSTGGGRGKKSDVDKYRPKISFHLIDFTSEDVFQSIHHCFLTHRSLFLCLWDTAKGIESLKSLVPWLRGIQASAPGSSVVIIGSHIDQRPALSRATIAGWEREVFGDTVAPTATSERDTYPKTSGFPLVSDSVVMSCQNKRDVEKLMENIYRISLHLKHPKTRVTLVNEMVPRSYQELQTLVEVKLRGFQRKGQAVPVLRREEFIDHVRSLTLHHHDNLDQDKEEFALAVKFLHEAGTIIHYKSQTAGVGELFFLSPQWLFNTLGTILSQLKAYSQNALVSNSYLPQVFETAHVPAHFYSNFLTILEDNDVIVSLDMEKNYFLVPSVLTSSPPTNYPSYNLSDNVHKYLMQYVHLDYLPSGFFPRLLARVLICLHMLSGQLLTLHSSPLVSSGEGDVRLDAAATAPCSYGTVHHQFQLDTLGYVQENDMAGGAAGTEKGLRDKIWALSTTNLATWSSRHRSLMKKLVTLSRPILRRKKRKLRRTTNGGTANGGAERGTREGEGEGGEMSEGEENTTAANQEEKEEQQHSGESKSNPLDLFSENVVWKKGMHVEFPCGTQFWLEACEGALVMITRGEMIPKVKVITFLSACVDMLVSEYYSGVRLVNYSPCPSCLARYWSDRRGGGGEVSSLAGGLLKVPSFAESDLELSGECNSLVLNEFNETASFVRRSSIGSGNLSKSFSGTTLKLERSLSPTATTDDRNFTTFNAAGDVVEEIPCVLLDNSVILYSLSSLVAQSALGNSLQCTKCDKPVALSDIGPHVLLVDFSDKLLISSRRLIYGEGKGSVLGEGGFGKVVKGTYDEHPVAVKLFRRSHRPDSLVQQYNSLREEVTVFSHLDHPRVVKLMGVTLRPLCLVMDLAPQGSLANHLHLCRLGLSHVMAHRTLYQIADGIAYLHSLYIIHRDIKPGNILVWSLDPNKGVDVRLADYGVSQFSTPSGLQRQRGTEEYMAPELRDSHNTAYDEKVDIFSFALLLHLVVTGRTLFAGILNRREQLQLIYHADIPQVSQALSKSIEDNRPQSPVPSLQHVFAHNVTHPAARQNVDSSCHSICMQPLMEDCLARRPDNRPSARGICSRLLVCPGTLRQARFFVPYPVSRAGYCPSENHIVAMQEGRSEEAMLIIPGAWLFRQKTLPYAGQKITCCAVVGTEVVMGSEVTNLIFSVTLPSLTSGHISPILLPGAPLCIIPQETAQGTKVIVGMSAARIAVFSPPGQGRHLLETHPFITQVMSNTTPEKTKMSCGVYHRGVVWCGCGRHLAGLDSNEYVMKHYKPVLKDGTCITRIVCALGYLWLCFSERSELVTVNTRTAQCGDPINCHLILGQSCSSLQATITDLVSSGEAVWAATMGGHVMTFDPVSADVLLIHRRYSHVSCLVCVGLEQVVVFGSQRIEGAEEDEEQTVFTVWDSYVKYRIT